MKHTILKTLNTAVAAMAVCAAAIPIATPVLAQNEQPTPGYNTKIPEKIMTPDKVETPIGALDFFDAR